MCVNEMSCELAKLMLGELRIDMSIGNVCRQIELLVLTSSK